MNHKLLIKQIIYPNLGPKTYPLLCQDMQLMDI